MHAWSGLGGRWSGRDLLQYHGRQSEGGTTQNPMGEKAQGLRGLRVLGAPATSACISLDSQARCREHLQGCLVGSPHILLRFVNFLCVFENRRSYSWGPLEIYGTASILKGSA